MKLYAEKAQRQEGATADNLMVELERRLDTVVFRAGFADTPRQARQMTGHGNFIVNGRRMNVPSFKVSVGDTIEVRPKLKKSVLYGARKQEPTPPRWLAVDRKNLVISVQALPAPEDVAMAGIDSRLVTEFYSR